MKIFQISGSSSSLTELQTAENTVYIPEPHTDRLRRYQDIANKLQYYDCQSSCIEGHVTGPQTVTSSSNYPPPLPQHDLSGIAHVKDETFEQEEEVLTIDQKEEPDDNNSALELLANAALIVGNNQHKEQTGATARDGNGKRYNQ